MNSAIENAIARIWEDYSEPLSLADIAKSAFLSRFHFSRVFSDATGVSPGRFLSAVRIYQAKRLLASTSLSVTEISLSVGYNSLGSFTNRFTESVGASPTRFRRMSRDGIRSLPCTPVTQADRPAMVTGAVRLPAGYRPARVFLGIFRTPIIQCRPLAWTIAEPEDGQPGQYKLADVPSGQWYVRAVATVDSADPEPWTRRLLLMGGQGPVKMSQSAPATVDIALRPRRRSDLPILFAVPDLELRDIETAGGELPWPGAETRPAWLATYAAARAR